MKCLICLNIIMLILVIISGISLFVKDKATDVTYAYSENLLDELYEQGGRGGKGGRGNGRGNGIGNGNKGNGNNGNKGNGRGSGRGNGKGGRGSRGTN